MRLLFGLVLSLLLYCRLGASLPNFTIGPRKLEFAEGSQSIRMMSVYQGNDLFAMKDMEGLTDLYAAGSSTKQHVIYPRAADFTLARDWDLYPLPLDDIQESIELMNGWTVTLASHTFSGFASLKVSVVQGRFLNDNFKPMHDVPKYTNSQLLVLSGGKYFNPTIGGHSLLIPYVELPRDCFFGQETIKIPNHGIPTSSDKLYIFEFASLRYYMSILNEDSVYVFAIHKDLIPEAVEMSEEDESHAASTGDDESHTHAPSAGESSQQKNSHIAQPSSEEADKTIVLVESELSMFDDHTAVAICTLGIVLGIFVLVRVFHAKRKMNRAKALLTSRNNNTGNKRRFIRK